MNIANSRYHKVRKIEKSEQNKVGKNEKIGKITNYEMAGGNHD